MLLGRWPGHIGGEGTAPSPSSGTPALPPSFLSASPAVVGRGGREAAGACRVATTDGMWRAELREELPAAQERDNVASLKCWPAAWLEPWNQRVCWTISSTSCSCSRRGVPRTLLLMSSSSSARTASRSSTSSPSYWTSHVLTLTRWMLLYTSSRAAVQVLVLRE